MFMDSEIYYIQSSMLKHTPMDATSSPLILQPIERKETRGP